MSNFKKNIIKVALVLQLLILLSSMSMASPELPIVLDGEVTLDGEPASPGTTITVKLGEDQITRSTLSESGGYDTLLIPESGISNLKFYVNGVEANIMNPDSIENAKSGQLIKLNLAATTPENGGSDNDSPTPRESSGGMAAPPGDQDEVDGIDDTGDSTEESVLPSPGISDGLEETDEISAPVPTPEGSSVYLYALVLLLFMVLIAVGVLRNK
ncbi:hypothetical protein [Methanosalsum natronophilum]|uniref:hypothetical protein n=1 Tax=Methanosalsum natronophilum TaxID=768733 RepID=UPI00216A92BE|nr:hypothetical protein [Methanosalsum natronophilum]MCS3923572.1 hypothetical protein [Methanosalsum natronophilum]